MRLALVDGRAVVDRPRRLPGRGAYLHDAPDCLEKATARRGLQRAFRAQVSVIPRQLDSDD